MTSFLKVLSLWRFSLHLFRLLLVYPLPPIAVDLAPVLVALTIVVGVYKWDQDVPGLQKKQDGLRPVLGTVVYKCFFLFDVFRWSLLLSNTCLSFSLLYNTCHNTVIANHEHTINLCMLWNKTSLKDNPILIPKKYGKRRDSNSQHRPSIVNVSLQLWCQKTIRKQRG